MKNFSICQRDVRNSTLCRDCIGRYFAVRVIDLDLKLWYRYWKPKKGLKKTLADKKSDIDYAYQRNWLKLTVQLQAIQRLQIEKGRYGIG
ncbi:MAG: hypothetical protein R3E08_09120 [Thiotrichaceae bacterium]